jgi:dTDP-4-dehydrorhamnose reductase
LKKFIITGSNGLLGQKLVCLLKAEKQYEIHAFSRGEDQIKKKEGYTYYNVDITEKEKVTNLISTIQPDYIINAAAMTNVDACEMHQKECDAINVEAVSTLVASCKENNIHLIHLSTDFIFDGLKEGLYTEDDEPNPLSYYGLSKLKSEDIILKAKIRYTILRTILVYGMVDRDDRSNIVLWVKNSIENKKSIKAITDQFRMPTFVDDLAEACLLAIKNNALGVYNVSSNTLLSIYEIALIVAETFNLDAKYISACKTSDLNLPAKRPYKTGFDLNKSIKELNLPSYSFNERLQVYKNQLDSKTRISKR